MHICTGRYFKGFFSLIVVVVVVVVIVVMVLLLLLLLLFLFLQNTFIHALLISIMPVYQFIPFSVALIFVQKINVTKTMESKTSLS